MPKYHNKKISAGNDVFDSKKEYDRWVQLKLFSKAGIIKDLHRQVPFELIPAQYDASGKCIEKPCKYIADFVYQKDGKTVVEDVKGYKNGGAYSIFVIKRKLMLERYGISVKEI